MQLRENIIALNSRQYTLNLNPEGKPQIRESDKNIQVLSCKRQTEVCDHVTPARDHVLILQPPAAQIRVTRAQLENSVDQNPAEKQKM